LGKHDLTTISHGIWEREHQSNYGMINGIKNYPLLKNTLYNNSHLKMTTISNMRIWNNNEWERKLKWRREWFDWELHQVEYFRNELIRYLPKIQGQDSWIWKGEDMDTYTVKSGYKILQNIITGKKDEFFELLWRTSTIPNVKQFIWRIDKTKLQPGILCQTCVLCKEQDETIQHLFLNCKVSTMVWNLCNKWIGLKTISHVWDE